MTENKRVVLGIAYLTTFLTGLFFVVDSIPMKGTIGLFLIAVAFLIYDELKVRP